nr:amidohydrolase family protein [Sphingomonas sp. Y57]
MTGVAEHFDLLIRNGMVVDGTGLPRRRLDVGVRDGKIAKFAHLAEATADEEIDAKGCIVAPGIVDPHTHYDPQITFDPYATVSCFHGVTTVLAGNCGFSVAPCKAQDREYLKGIFARVEEMNPIALGAVRWDEFETFEEFLATRKGRLGINFACYVGHSNLRRWVMGDDSHRRAATEDEVRQMRAMLAEALEAGAAGLSSSAAAVHMDINGDPVPSRLAERSEFLALAEELGRFGKGSITFLPASSIGGLDEEDKEYLIELGKRSGVPVIIQGLGGRNKVDAPTATWEASVEFLDRATAAGAPVYSLLISRPFDRPVVFGPECPHYAAVASWHAMMRLPKAERDAMLRDPAARDEMRQAVENYNRDPQKGTILPPPLWAALFVDHVANDRNAALQGKSVVEIAAETGKAPGDVVLDLLLDEDMATEFRWRTETPEWAEAVRVAQQDPRMIVGVSDGGAHLAKDDAADWSSYFLRSWVLDRGAWTLEEGIRQITQIPASLLGLVDRGTLKVTGPADIMIFDPETIGPWRKEFARDLPGGVGRFKAWGKGVKATIVNGRPIVLDGALTTNLPGEVVSPA